MASYLWPRLEVLQLVIPSLGCATRGLQITHVLDVMKALTTITANSIAQSSFGLQSLSLSFSTSQKFLVNHFVSFEKWILVARSTLKWNDSCGKLFWDMLSIAILYSDKKHVRNEEGIMVEHILIFLILHIADLGSRPTPSSTSQYDAIWPNTVDLDPMSPSSPSSSSKRVQITNSPPSSPPAVSPRSAKNLASSPKYSKSSSQHLQSLRRKLSLIISIIASDFGAIDELKNSRDEFMVDIQTLNIGGSEQSQGSGMISNKQLDSLGLIVGGGYSFSSDHLPLSSLFPEFRSQSFDLFVPSTEVLSWILSNLTSNDLFYPSGIYNPASPKHSLSSTSSSNKIFFPPPNVSDTAVGSILSPQMIDDYGSNTLSSPRYIASQTSTQQPQRILSPISSLSKANSTLVHGCNISTYLHIVCDEPSIQNQPQGSKFQSLCDDDRQDNASLLRQDIDEKMQISSGVSDAATSEGELTDISDKDLSLKSSKVIDSPSREPLNAPSSLPTLSITSCVRSTIYALSPYSSGTISSCRECEIVIGPVSGVLVIIGCEKVKLSVICRKLLIHNCVECDIYIATLSPTVIVGDSRSLSFAPYNVVYRSLRWQLSVAGLETLTMTSSNNSHIPVYSCDRIVNHWCILCDVNLCLESLTVNASPTGEVLRESIITLPSPTASTANILPLEKYSYIVVPYREEHVTADKFVIPLPDAHREAIRLRKKRAILIQKQLNNLVTEGDTQKSSEMQSNYSEGNDESAETAENVAAISPVLSKKFFDWLIRSGKINEVMDLIRIDADTAKNHHVHSRTQSIDDSETNDN